MHVTPSNRVFKVFRHTHDGNAFGRTDHFATQKIHGKRQKVGCRAGLLNNTDDWCRVAQVFLPFDFGGPRSPSLTDCQIDSVSIRVGGNFQLADRQSVAPIAMWDHQKQRCQ